MSQASNLKSTSISNLDSTPVISNTTGEGGAGSLVSVNDMVTALSGDTTASTYKVVRIPTTAHVKEVKLWSAVASAGAADINIAFSDSQVDGTSAGNQNTIPQMSSANNKLFGAASSLVSQSGVDITYANLTNFPYGSENAPLWSVLGYTADPGGYFDIQLNVTTAITTGGVIMIRVTYTNPGAG